MRVYLSGEVLGYRTVTFADGSQRYRYEVYQEGEREIAQVVAASDGNGVLPASKFAGAVKGVSVVQVPARVKATRGGLWVQEVLEADVGETPKGGKGR